jgi:hypothetical protein
MSWTFKHSHGVSGHIYEMIEYYYTLKNRFNVGLLICENITPIKLREICSEKYNFTAEELDDIVNNTTFHLTPRVVRGKYLLVVDGNISRAFVGNGIKLIFKKIFCFRCSPRDSTWNLPYTNVVLLQDQRVYKDKDSNHAIDYKKKILFDRYRAIDSKPTRTNMLYLTSNCRSMNLHDIHKCISTHTNEQYIILTNSPDRYTSLNVECDVSFPSLPVNDIFSKFDNYIYTPVSSSCDCFDCSPRFIAECHFYNKHVKYYGLSQEYISKDTGLFYRRLDIDTDFSSLNLTDSDMIYEILSTHM